MLLTLLLSLAVTQADDPTPVTIKLNHDQFSTGERAKVYVQTAQDGYLVVLHADAMGRIRVLFPLDPSEDDFVRGNRRVEVRGRGDRDAFQIEGDEGSGTVLAAVSHDPFTFTAFVRNDHWDFRALGGPSATVRDDPLARLLDIAQQMTADSAGHFEYDAATYVVTGRYASRYDGYHFGVGLALGSPYGFGYCDPFFFGWSASCYGFGRFGYGWGYRYGFGYPVVYRPYFRPRPWLFTSTLGANTRAGGAHFVIPRNRDRFTPVEVRPRTGAVSPRAGSFGGGRQPMITPRNRGSSGSGRSWSGGGSRTPSRGSKPSRPSNGGTRRH